MSGRHDEFERTHATEDGLELWSLPTEFQPHEDESETVFDRFKRFHQENPDVYRLFRNKARKLHRVGRRHYGARRIFESMRYDHDIQTTGDDFKLNNDFCPLYARLLMMHEPQWFEGFFEMRTSRSPVTDNQLRTIEV